MDLKINDIHLLCRHDAYNNNLTWNGSRRWWWWL